MRICRLMSTRSVRHQLVVHHHAGRDVHRAAPVRHLLVGVIAHRGIVERAPARQQHAPPPHFFVARQRLVEEIEEVVVQRNHFLHELHVLHQAHDVVGEKLNRRHRSHSARIQRRRMHVPAFHQAEHLAGHAAHLQRFAIERTGKRIQRLHDVGNRAVAVQVRARRGRLFRLGYTPRGWFPSPSARRNPRPPGCPGKYCGRTCTRRPRRG